MILSKLGLVSILLAGLVGNAAIVDVNSLNQTLKKQKQRWTAKDSWVNRLSLSEAKAMMGAPTIDTDIEFFSDEATVQWGPAMPRSVDWRDKDGKNWVSPILHQGACGSCVAFAAAGTLETQINISALMPSLNVLVSPQQLFSCGGGMCDRGWYPEAAAQFLKKTGIVDQACMPYSSGVTGLDVACNQQCSNSATRTLKIADYKKPTFWFNGVKKALLKGPLMASMTVYADFMTYGSGVYKHTTGEKLGGHAISIIGYDDDKKAWIIRNSWSTDWGDKGFAYVDYKDTSGISTQNWSFEVPAMNSIISVDSPRDRDYLTGDVELKSSSNVASASHVRYTVIKQDSSVEATITSDIKATQIKAATTSWADGKYQVMAEALDSADRVVAHSTYQYFYVVNSMPQVSVSFSSATDLTKPISGRIVLEIVAKSSSVPLNMLEFHYKNQAGKETVRSTSTVVDDMKTGWKTTSIPNGVYEIWFTTKVTTNQINATAESEHQKVSILN